MSYKKYTIIILSIATILFGVRMGALLLLDPLQLFHRPLVHDNYFIPAMRVQAAGIINTSDFDSIIIGSSIAQNFSPSEASDLWNAKFVNISPTGGILSERSIILNYALEKKELKNVVVSLDGFREYGEFHPNYPLKKFAFLYNKNRVDDLKIYLRNRYTKYLFCRNIIFNFDSLCEKTRELEAVTKWSHSKKSIARFGGLENWLNTRSKDQITQDFRTLLAGVRIIGFGSTMEVKKDTLTKESNNIEIVFNEYILSHIKENTDTNFHLFFPPYSRLHYALWKQSNPRLFELYTMKIRYIVSQIEELDNARVYGFDHLDFPNHIANYSDVLHYHTRFNSKMLIWMNADTHNLTNENIEQYIDKITQMAADYDVVSVGERIKEHIKLLK